MSTFWNPHKKNINKLAHKLFFSEKLTWHRLVSNFDVNGEGSQPVYIQVELKCLIGYNDFRTWPMDRPGESGVIDMQNMYIILNKEYLREEGYLNENDYFALNSQRDYFTLRGIHYEDSGDTDVSQAGSDPLLVYLILKRKEYETGKEVHGWPPRDNGPNGDIP